MTTAALDIYAHLLNLTKVAAEIYSQEEREKAWSEVAGKVEAYSDELIKQWIREIDGLLTFVRPSQLNIRPLAG